MKRQFVIAIAVLAITLSLSVVASAQQTNRLKISIPFAFQADNQAFPSGDYQVSWIGSRLMIGTADGKRTGLFVETLASHRDASTRNYMKFNKYGEKYFLTEVSVAGQDSTHEVQKSKLEKELASRHEPSTYAMVGFKNVK